MFRVMLFSMALLLTSLAHAMEHPFSQQEFEALREADQPVLVFIHADWCPTCNRQAVVLNELFALDEYNSIARLRVDFDSQRSVVEDFGVRYQSTLILFRGDHELGRSTADIDKTSIAQLLAKAL